MSQEARGHRTMDYGLWTMDCGLWTVDCGLWHFCTIALLHYNGSMGSLLAVDLGLKTGLALYGPDGRLCWYRSKNYGTTAALKRGAYALLNSVPDLSLLVMEGGGALAVIWEREAARRNISVKQINAETWRRKLLYPREQHTGLQAKHYADDLARRTIAWSGISRPPSLRHDTAEAILIGLWAVLDAGWLKKIPKELKR